MRKELKSCVILLAIVGCAFILSGCKVTGFSLNLNSGDGHERAPAKKTYAKRGPLNIPPGHLPPLGMCKIWYPNTPPGRQSKRSGDCRTLQRRVPPGAWLISHPGGRASNTVDVSVYEKSSSGSLSLKIRTYNFETGIFISER